MAKNIESENDLMTFLTKKRNLSVEVEAVGLLAFVLLFVCGPVAVSANTSGNIFDSYSVAYSGVVGALGDALLDASENQGSVAAAVVRGTIYGDSDYHAVGSTTPPRKSGFPGDEHSSTTPQSWMGDNGMGTMTLGVNHEDASSTVTITIQLSPAEIKTLQQFLNKNGFNISQSGDGSTGNENTNFGPKTVQAFRKFLQFLRSHEQGGQNGQGQNDRDHGQGGMGSTTTGWNKPPQGSDHDGMGSSTQGWNRPPQGGMGSSTQGSRPTPPTGDHDSKGGMPGGQTGNH